MSEQNDAQTYEITGPPDEQLSAMQSVLAERRRQNEKWGEQNHHDFVWLAVATEELGEVAQAMLHDQFGGDHAGTVRDELVQLAAVALQWIECIDRRPACRVCGCTDDNACLGGCWWIEPDLCSACADSEGSAS